MSATHADTIAGIGCRKGAPLADVLAAIDAALAVHGLVHGDLGALATIARKGGEPAIAGAAERLGLPLVIVRDDAARKASGRCLTRSPASLAMTGIACVSEAAALAATAPAGRLMHPRSVRGGATCAIALTSSSAREPRA